MNWKPGPARTRSGEHEAEIGIVDETGIYGRVRDMNSKYWRPAKWSLDGMRYCAIGDTDLIPPTITLE